ncbi:hypothetical protein Hanom_Chr10g00940531 [Helianthus anomalus]
MITVSNLGCQNGFGLGNYSDEGCGGATWRQSWQWIVSFTFHQNYNFKKPFLYLARKLAGLLRLLHQGSNWHGCLAVSFAFGLYQLWVVGYLVYDASLCFLNR